MRRNGIGQISQLRNVGGSTDVYAFGMVIQRGVGSCEGRWEAAIHRRVDKLGTLCKEQLSNVVERKARLFHSVCYRHSLEITPVMNFTSLTVHERVVGGYK